MASAAPPAAQPPLPDEILEDIFLRLDAADDLARASASCASFRRIVSARGFLRRFRSLHPPPVLGFLDCSYGTGTEFHEAQPPRKWAPAARAFAQAADFTLSFLDDPSRWRVLDVRDGRVLLGRFTTSWVVFEDFVVHDPLHRRYVQIPLIPDDQTAFTRQPGSQHYKPWTSFEPFLAPAAWEEEEQSLRVFCNVVSKAKIVTFVFSSVTGMWQAVASFSIGTHEWMTYPLSIKRHCTHGCFYWTDYHQEVMLVLDTLEMKFSMVDLPHESKGKGKVIVEAADGRLGLLILRHFEVHLYSKTNRHNDVGAGEWRRDNIIPLPKYWWSIPKYWWSISRGGVAEGYVLLRGIPRGQLDALNVLEKKPDVEYFTLQLKTLLFERLCVLKCRTSDDYLYASFPPPLSPPSI